jgi:hypothetical protein
MSTTSIRYSAKATRPVSQIGSAYRLFCRIDDVALTVADTGIEAVTEPEYGGLTDRTIKRGIKKSLLGGGWRERRKDIAFQTLPPMVINIIIACIPIKNNLCLSTYLLKR